MIFESASYVYWRVPGVLHRRRKNFRSGNIKPDSWLDYVEREMSNWEKGGCHTSL